MTNRERLLAILAGRSADRIPWIPRLQIWYNAHCKAGTLPAEFRNRSLRAIEQELGLGTPAREGNVIQRTMRGVEVQQRKLNDLETLTEYHTSVGSLSTLFRGSQILRERAIEDMQVEFLLKRREDYAVVEYLIEQTQVEAVYDQYQQYDAEIGEDGLPMVHCGDCPFHHWMRSLVGYENAYFHLNDHPREVERLLALMTQHDQQQVWQRVADSPARLILHGVHFSSQMTPPAIFERHISPYYQEFSQLLHAHDKSLAVHADNDTRHILAQIRDAGFDMAECFATHPLVDTTLAEARAAWGKDVIIWGGVPSVILEDPYTEEQFESHMGELFDTLGQGEAFILGVADNVMPEAKIDRLRRITQWVESR